MSPHDELDLLSGYLDGELEDSDRVRLEAHLPSCAECRTTLDALRATIADLNALPEPIPTEQDSWALRSAIARARRQPKRWQKAAMAAGTAAAALIAFVAVTQNGDGGRSSGGAGAQFAESGASAPVLSVAGNYTKETAQAHLLEVAGITSDTRAIVGAPGSGPQGTSGFKSRATPTVETYDAMLASRIAEDARPPELDRCIDVVRSSTQRFLEPVVYEVATFESKPAFLLFFRTPDRYELWVVTRPGCETLFFSQAGS